ncbi:NUDIX domain-containing protein [Streptomyces sp. CC208A]|uniref:NUDIX hydrolase n=1 Tax=Streptomyces sp. CC208A TaxID=3044573 RepID=UPI0024A90972|nr:NUDIX domain-containing protein [Streptomyces sp. CC208A]
MPRPPAVEFLDTAVGFVEHPTPELTSWEQSEVDRLWEETRSRNPAVFDGPIAAALGVDRPDTGPLLVKWAPMTYRYRALRRLRPPEQVPGSLYVTVLVPTERGILVGRGSPGTARPGCWTLPGGAVEPPAPGRVLDVAGLRRHAARELLEEVGLRVPSGELRLWALARGRRFGSLGFHFVCPATSSELVRRHHAGLPEAPDGHGAGPELDELAFVTSQSEATGLGPTADYLPQVLHRYFSSP